MSAWNPCAEIVAANRLARWERTCPPLYRETDPARLPADKLAEVLAWSYGPMGLILSGPTRSGKTRCAWELIHRLIVDDGLSVKAFDGIGWGASVSAAYGDPSRTEWWLDEVCTVPVLFLDDLFKAKITEAQELAVYGVFERRCANLLPVICTTNTTSQLLGDRMTEAGRADRLDPLLGRMREFCTPIRFSAKYQENNRAK